MSTEVKNATPKTATTESQKGIDNHKKAAMHLEQAAKHHHEAAKLLLEGNDEKACGCVAKAQGHSILAKKAQKKNLKKMAVTK